MFRRIIETILDGLEYLKEKVSDFFESPVGQQVCEDLKGIGKEALKLVPATLIGIFAAYHFPVFLAAIASIPVMKWVVDKWNLPPTTKVGVQLAIVFLLDVVFAFFPFVTLVLGILAVYSDIDLVIDKITSAYTKIESGLEKAIEGADNATATATC